MCDTIEYTQKHRKKDTMDRKPSRDLKRQISFTKTIRMNAVVKHEARIAELDQRVEDLKIKLAEAEADEA